MAGVWKKTLTYLGLVEDDEFEQLDEVSGPPAQGEIRRFQRPQPVRELDYEPMPARRALAEAIGWLALSPHVPPVLRRTLRLSHEVYDARCAELPRYRAMIAPRPSTDPSASDPGDSKEPQ